jgi:predicted TIM-barrel fold metal-dependent hydrolase
MNTADTLKKFDLFDSHLHIIDKQYPLIANNGYLPDEFTCQAYRAAMAPYHLIGGAVVSGSFQAFDQTYLIAALNELGPSFVGVTQVPSDISDDDILALDKAGVRAVRFNIKRGGSLDLAHLHNFAARIYELALWHVELYIDSRELVNIFASLIQLPAVSIDHLGLSAQGLPREPLKNS